MQQRYYDPIAGRFLSIDPIVTDANTGKGFGLYTYVDNNPYAKVDPDGRDPEHSYIPKGMTYEQYRAANERAGGIAIVGTAGLALVAPVALELGAVGLKVGVDALAGGSLWGGVVANAPAVNAAGVTLAEAAGVGTGLGVAAKGISARVEAVHGALDPIAAGRRTTAALDTVEGTRILAAGGRDLSPAQRALMAPGEVAAKLPGAHAEATALRHAAQAGLTPAQMAVSRTICPTCRAAIEQSGGQLTSPTTAI